MQTKHSEATPTVLLVDDDPSLLRGYARVLRDAGHEVLTADCATQALDLLGKTSVGLVLCDIALPETDGVTLLKRMREQQRDLPVVLMTGAPAIDTAIKAVEYGAF